ncbi:hypothetical protein SDC9_126598 [bioreactor metagenome]|uniref:Uncharacterized protein n=1 Tax=bioreactor metagenome TaxID=1076179 RepID=A0A645CR35_9ZZZZ
MANSKALLIRGALFQLVDAKIITQREYEEVSVAAIRAYDSTRIARSGKHPRRAAVTAAAVK